LSKRGLPIAYDAESEKRPSIKSNMLVDFAKGLLISREQNLFRDWACSQCREKLRPWTPSAKELSLIRPIIDACIRKHDPWFYNQLSKFYLQYYGEFNVDNDHHRLTIHFSLENNTEWRENPSFSGYLIDYEVEENKCHPAWDAGMDFYENGKAPRNTEEIERMRKIVTCEKQLKSLIDALEKYRKDIGKYPDKKLGLDGLLKNIDKNSKWKGPYIKEAQKVDPWGNEIRFETSPKSRLKSDGPFKDMDGDNIWKDLPVSSDAPVGLEKPSPR
jgi:hypothetical protein